MLHKHHRPHHNAPIGVMLGRLALGVAASMLQKKITDRLTEKPQPHDRGPSRDPQRRGPGDPPCSPCPA